jgi:hypothetical protein
MKRPSVSSLLIVILLFVSSHVQAQEKGSQNSDLLRVKIEQLESTDIKSKSPSVQDIYKRSLLRLYEQYVAALEQDMADLRAISSTTEGTGAGDEAATQLRKLINEQLITNEKLLTLRGDVRSAASAATVASQPTTAPAGGQIVPAALSRPRSSAATSSAMTLTNPEATPVASISSIPSIASVASAPAAAAADTAAAVQVCGQIRPASLTQTFAFIRSANAGLTATKTKADSDNVEHSSLGQTCEDDSNKFKVGSQKKAVVETLQQLLADIKSTSGMDSESGSLSQDTIKKQILLLNSYIGNVAVRIENADGTLVATSMTDNDGNYRASLAPGKYYISTEADSGQTRREVIVTAGTPLRVNIPIEDRPVSLLTRAVVGYEQAGAAAAQKKQDYFFDLFISSTFPFRQKINPDFGERFRTWVDLRFSSVPQSGEATLGAFSTGFATQVAGLKIKDVANVFDFLAGFEYRLTGNDALLPSFDRRTKQKFSLSLIAGGGTITPTNPLDSITTFKVFDAAPGLPPAAIGKQFVAFVQNDRDRFFRQYYAGLRIQTFFFNLHNIPMQRFPAQLDLTVGQNEFVTGGKLHGPVVRIEGYFPLPYENLKFINIIGTAVLRPGHALTSVPLVLEPAPAGTIVPGPNVALIAIPQPNRDYYRAGFGLDFISFVQKLRDAMSKK